MVRDFPKDVIVEVLYETGTKRPKTISRKSGICLRTVQRYVSKLKQGLPPSRNPYKKRKGKVTSAIRKRVFMLIRNKKQPSLRKIAIAAKISHEQVRQILADSGWSYKLRQKRVKINPEKREKRVQIYYISK